MSVPHYYEPHEKRVSCREVCTSESLLIWFKLALAQKPSCCTHCCYISTQWDGLIGWHSSSLWESNICSVLTSGGQISGPMLTWNKGWNKDEKKLFRMNWTILKPMECVGEWRFFSVALCFVVHQSVPWVVLFFHASFLDPTWSSLLLFLIVWSPPPFTYPHMSAHQQLQYMTISLQLASHHCHNRQLLEKY